MSDGIRLNLPESGPMCDTESDTELMTLSSVTFFKSWCHIMAIEINKDAVYRAAKPKEKDYTIKDGGGLEMVIKADGVKRWVFRYRADGKQNKLGFGVYPETTLENARRKAEEARQQIAEGIDPGKIRRQEKAAKQLAKQNQGRQKEGLPILDSFADITRQWLASIAHLTTVTTHTKKTSRIER
ncbi:Arm DNA-binding domain-containing protein, partial [Methylomonas koyamae]|uniref:Arm DNA-binding domain-containing protein n=1 Tax=Methylomonas koyamae TaxID=702114 RepID=UPI0012F6C82B